MHIYLLKQTHETTWESQPSSACSTVKCGTGPELMSTQKETKKTAQHEPKYKAAVYTSFRETGWLRTRLAALGVGAKRWFVKKTVKEARNDSSVALADNDWTIPTVSSSTPQRRVGVASSCLKALAGVELQTHGHGWSFIFEPNHTTKGGKKQLKIK